MRDQTKLSDTLTSIRDEHTIEADHCAAQPSHDWATKEPLTDLELNLGTTLNILECMRTLGLNESLFVYFSTNKVYGSGPNQLPLIELHSRYELPDDHHFYSGISEEMSVDKTLHSFFGCSKVAADIYVQEYAYHLGMKCAFFRRLLDRGRHRGAKLHGFMNFLIKSSLLGEDYSYWL